MKVGDLVKVKVVNPTSRDPYTGLVVETIEYGNYHTKFARVALTNGYIATYRLSNLEVISAKKKS